jgi:hypothetical protein
MKKRYTFCLIIWLATPAFAQYYPPSIQWQKAFGTSGADFFEAVKPTTDGGFIAVGRTDGNDYDVSDNHGGFDVLVVKYDAVGSVQWKKCYGGTQSESGWDIQQTTDGGYIVAGQSSSSDGDLAANKGFADGWIFKISSLGTIQWQKAYGTSGSEAFKAVRLTSDGGYIVVGSCGANDGDAMGSGFKGGGGDVWLVKLNSSGAIVWQKAYGSSGGEGGNDIEITIDGGFIIAGITNGNDGDVSGFHAGTHNPPRLDMWVIKTDSTGILQWQKCLGGATSLSSNFPDDVAFAVQQATDGGYFIAGYTASIDGDVTNFKGGIRDGWIIKLSNSGDLLWQKTIGGSSQDILTDIIKHPDGGYVVCGYSNHFSGDLQELSLQQRGGFDWFLLKIDTAGVFQWKRLMGTSGEDVTGKMAVGSDEGFIVVGSITRNDFDASGNNTPTISSIPNAWIVKLSPQVLPVTLLGFTITKSNDVNVLKWETVNEVNFRHFTIERSDNGNFFSTIASVPANNVGALNKMYSYTDRDLPPVHKLYYRLKLTDNDGSYTYSSVVAARLEDQTTVNIFPNPVESLLNIRSDKPVKQLTISDVAGRIYFVEKGTDIKSINISTLRTGVYYLQIFDGNNTTNQLTFMKK